MRRSACNQVAKCVVWISRAYKQNQKPTRLSKADTIPVGDAGGHDGSEAVGQPGRYLLRYRFVRSRPGLSHSSSSSHRVPCTDGNLDTPRNRGAADRALANARPVSPSASYLEKPQVTKGLCCCWVPPSSEYLNEGDAPWARRHPPSMAGGGSRGIQAARPTPRRLRSACTQVAICSV